MVYLGENNSKVGIKESETAPTHLNCFLGNRWGKEGGNTQDRNTGKSRVMEANIFKKEYYLFSSLLILMYDLCFSHKSLLYKNASLV